MTSGEELFLLGQTILITGAARRLGKDMALTIARHGGNLIIHYHQSKEDAEYLQRSIQELGAKSWMVSTDLSSEKGIDILIEKAFRISPLTALINNASIFGKEPLLETTGKSWRDHLEINLTTPFLLSKSFASHLQTPTPGRIINMLDWRALRPGKDHFAYTVSKAALASMTESLALALAPNIAVNAIALGAILPPENEKVDPTLLQKVPLKRWAYLSELENLLLYLLHVSPALTGQVIHLDGGRHLIP
jgi:NAD(P)-dependent dehydrogenase (short-subunit alcohol dehydrogenase family)